MEGVPASPVPTWRPASSYLVMRRPSGVSVGLGDGACMLQRLQEPYFHLVFILL